MNPNNTAITMPSSIGQIVDVELQGQGEFELETKFELEFESGVNPRGATSPGPCENLIFAIMSMDVRNPRSYASTMSSTDRESTTALAGRPCLRMDTGCASARGS